ncbi:hypothetical protein B0H10DRAFT_1953509 [Mycena sp. CBHHK59/15]|nr:hypothetical protein B0H10DRAFT_1953509 [Mycena sp. CBHHK59/15]
MCQVTIEEMEDDEDSESLSLSEQEEEGLGDVEEIFAGLVLDAPSIPPQTPCPPRNPMPPAHFPIPLTSSHVVQSPARPSPLPNQQYAAGPISFTPADQCFRYTPVVQPAGLPSQPPLSQKVEQFPATLRIGRLHCMGKIGQYHRQIGREGVLALMAYP